ncbi:hypothetical protein POM88_047423 [Heracleum sosnowskyi]|uniref:SWIM-type domain-containing protein n=1 Tax=Heracleum sosnowskyi TaxID=360622 RepID=A0AAD8LZM3_9APIA|nr:hypothetical protein POM88_047423 [Heracleum sosnowskyi]
MKACVWSDYLTEDEFEQNWNAIIEEYQLSDNGWLNDMYTIRKEWIPAYFNDVSMVGLLRTTSRSESSNFYFQHFHRSGDTLVDFMKRYDSAMDRQRNLNAQNNRDSEFKFNSITRLKIDKDASRLYTRHLYYLVAEEIEAAWHHTRIDDMSLVNDVKHFKVKDSLLNGKVFEVKVRLSDHDVQCDCKHYTRRGYLCRHAFASLHQCNIDEIPRAFVMTRWTKNAEKRHDTLGSHEIPDYCAEVDEVKLILNEIWFDFQSCMSATGHDRERALKMRAHVNTMKDDMKGSTSQTGVRLTEANIRALIDDEPRSDVVVVQNPNISRNKGCGSRIKSGKEKSMDAINAKRRKCSKCGLAVGHNSRSCPGPTENVVVLTQSLTKENATPLTTSSS